MLDLVYVDPTSRKIQLTSITDQLYTEQKNLLNSTSKIEENNDILIYHIIYYTLSR